MFSRLTFYRVSSEEEACALRQLVLSRDEIVLGLDKLVLADFESRGEDEYR